MHENKNTKNNREEKCTSNVQMIVVNFEMKWFSSWETLAILG